MIETFKQKTPILFIDPTCRKKIQYWADAADGEVSGLGIVESEKGIARVTEVFILEQECTGADTELKPAAISDLMTSMMSTGKDPSKLKFWWHSHVNMSVFWSGTDDACIETLSKEYAFSTVVNKKGESKTRFDIYDPFRLTFDNISLIEIIPEDKELKEQCKKDVEEKVKSTKFKWQGDDNWREKYGYAHGYGYNYDNNKVHVIKPDTSTDSSLSEDMIYCLKAFEDMVYAKAYGKDLIDSVFEETMKHVMSKHFKTRANCTDGVGTYEAEQQVCKECEVKSECKILSKKFPVIIEAVEVVEDTDVGDIEIIVSD